MGLYIERERQMQWKRDRQRKKFGFLWFSFVSLHITLCWLLNAKSSFYIYIIYIICKQCYFKQFNLAWVNKLRLFQVLLHITNTLIKRQSFVSTRLNDQRVLFQTILFSTSHFSSICSNIKHFYLTHRWFFVRCRHSEPDWTCVRW